MICYSQEDFNNSRFRDLLDFQCDVCGSYFKKSKRYAFNHIKFGNVGHSCSKECASRLSIKNSGFLAKTEMKCELCSKSFYRVRSATKRNKKVFCSLSCSASFNNSNKIHGCNRSKLEKWLEKELTSRFPNIEIHFNRIDAINAELDIYFPSLRLAFELNGIFHYEPIFGHEKLSKTQNNDNRKFQACLEKDIELCIIDVSSQKYVTPSTSQKFLDIITNLVNMKLSRIGRVEAL